MSINTHILSASSKIAPHKELLQKITTSIGAEVAKFLPVNDIDVVFYENPENTIKELGIGGFTPAANTIFISLDPNHPDFKKMLEIELPYTLAHEFHHAIRFRTPIPQDTLLEAMISEGLADHFAMNITKTSTKKPWCLALTPGQKEIYVLQSKQEWNSSKYNHGAWFFGSDPVSIPRWAGYTLAYDLVEKYLQVNKTKTAAILVDAKAEIFAEC